jgi:type I restriction enzyme M protein
MFDVVLANPPFMTPKGGIKPHKRFAIQANRSEVLFVDYIAEHLTTNGRAGIIVPEGIIFQSANAYQNLRKMLLDKYLWAVISLPAGVFNPYSGVKTSVLLLDKNLSKRTNKILFVKIGNDGFNLGAQRRELKNSELPIALEVLNRYKSEIPEGKDFIFKDQEIFAHTVDKSKILENKSYDFSGDRYKEIIQTKEDKYEMVELGDVIDFEIGSRDKGGAIDNGIPSIGGEQIAEDGSIRENKMKYVSEEHFKGMKKGILKDNDVLMVKDGATTGKIGFYKKIYEEAGINEHVYILRAKKEINPIYLYNLLKTDFFQTKLKRYIKGIIGGVSSEIKQIKIPLPPLEVQKEIVKKIEEKQTIINNAKDLISKVEREREQILKKYLND